MGDRRGLTIQDFNPHRKIVLTIRPPLSVLIGDREAQGTDRQ